MKKRRAFVVVCALWATACSGPQAVLVRPDIQVQPGTVGQGRSLALVVEDARASMTLGYSTSRKIILEGDLAASIRSVLIESLQRQGFGSITTSTSGERLLRVEIRNLEYAITGPTAEHWSMVRTICAVKANCVRNTNRVYERLYRAEQTEGGAFSIQLNPFSQKSTETNSRLVNKVVSDALNDMLSDKSLSRCLAQ